MGPILKGLPARALVTHLILFDGVCNFCSGWVQFILRRDPGKRFRFAALQSAAGRKVLSQMGLPPEQWTTIILVEGEKRYFRSTAALQIARRLGGLWPALFVFILLPPPLRDFLYEIVAKNRYRWFGKRDACFVPSQEVRDRFLE